MGVFYQKLSEGLCKLVAAHGEAGALCGDPALQLSGAEVSLPGAKRVICLKTALIAFNAIITQGEGAQQNSEDSHYQKFAGIRAEYQALLTADFFWRASVTAATNPGAAAATAPGRPCMDRGCPGHRDGRSGQRRLWPDAAPACAIPLPVPTQDPDKMLALDLSIGLMHALAPLAERAARLPAGPSNPVCHAGVSFITLRDASALPPGPGVPATFSANACSNWRMRQRA